MTEDQARKDERIVSKSVVARGRDTATIRWDVDGVDRGWAQHYVGRLGGRSGTMAYVQGRDPQARMDGTRVYIEWTVPLQDLEAAHGYVVRTLAATDRAIEQAEAQAADARAKRETAVVAEKARLEEIQQRLDEID